VSFLNQLKSQASALQSAHSVDLAQQQANTRLTETAATTIWLYVAELARQLNVIAPAGPRLSLTNKAPWPAMKLVDFQVDARKKTLRNQEVFDYIALSWRLVPMDGAPLAGSVSANFPPDLQRIESRLASGKVPHERVDVRHPEKNTLQAIRFDYSTQARAGVSVSAAHDEATFTFRLANLQGFEVLSASYPSAQIQAPLLDELAKLIVGQASRFTTQ